MKKITYFFLLLFSLQSSTLSASDSSDSFNLTNVTDGIYVHFGKHVSIDDKGNDDIANIGFIIGEKCIAVIDTGGSVKIGQALENSIRTISDKPICYVINTHVHFDHILGNLAFIDENPEFVGHYGLAEAVEHNRNFFLEQFKSSLGDNPNEASIIGPTILVEERKEIDLGNRILTLISFPVSHSRNDLIVIDQTSKTLWSGDLIFRSRIPSLTGSLKGWIKVMKDLQKLDITKVIPGHGNVAESLNEAMSQQQAYLELLLKETRKAVSDGLFVTDAMDKIDKNNQQGWLLHEYQHPTNVSRAFTELEWE